MFTSLYTTFALQSPPTWAKKPNCEPHIYPDSARSRRDLDRAACPQIEARSGGTASAVGRARIDGRSTGGIERERCRDRRLAAHTRGAAKFAHLRESGRVLGPRTTLSLDARRFERLEVDRGIDAVASCASPCRQPGDRDARRPGREGVRRIPEAHRGDRESRRRDGRAGEPGAHPRPCGACRTALGLPAPPPYGLRPRYFIMASMPGALPRQASYIFARSCVLPLDSII